MHTLMIIMLAPIAIFIGVQIVRVAFFPVVWVVLALALFMALANSDIIPSRADMRNVETGQPYYQNFSRAR